MHDYNTYVWARNCIHKNNYTQKNKLVFEVGTPNGRNKMIKTTEIGTSTPRASFRHVKAGVGVLYQSVNQSILSLFLPLWSPPFTIVRSEVSWSERWSLQTLTFRNAWSHACFHNSSSCFDDVLAFQTSRSAVASVANSFWTLTIELIKHKTWEAHKRWTEAEDAWLLNGFRFRAETLNRKEWGQMSHFDTNADTKNNNHQS